MNKSSERILRREFLGGGATLLGAAFVGLGSTLASASTIGFSSKQQNGDTHRLYFWNGSEFVLAQPARLSDGSLSAMRIRIEDFGSIASMSAIDVEMGGYLFHAFTAPPRGASTSEFSAHVCSERGVALLVRSGGSTTSFRFGGSDSQAIALSEGTYLLLKDGLDPSRLRLERELEQPLIDRDGFSATAPHVLIHLSAA